MGRIIKSRVPELMEAPTRLTKLVQIILNAGSSLGIRKSAGKQIGQMVADAANAESTLSVLNLLLKPLTSKQWEARIAAAFAMEQVFEAIRAIDGICLAVEGEEDEPADFDLASILQNCPELVSSGGSEFDIDMTSMGRKEFLKQQRKNVSQKLGFSEGMGMDDFANELVADEDLSAAQAQQTSAEAPPKKELSAREKAMLRRQSKIKMQKISSTATSLNTAEPDQRVNLDLIPMANFKSHFLADLLNDLQTLTINPNWYVRHGAILGLRAFFQTLPINQANVIDDIQLRLISILALDRFNDFNGDQVVAPVRETAAQTLALIINTCCSPQQNGLIFDYIWKLATNPSIWQVRLSGLLCLRYASLSLLGYEQKIFLLCFDLLDDLDDDVKGLSATIMVDLFPRLEIPVIEPKLIVDKILLLLSESDESRPVVGRLFSLLNALLTSNHGLFEPESLIQQLLPFLSYPSVATRKQAFDLIFESLNGYAGDNTILINLFRMAFQNVLLEEDDNVLRSSLKLLLSHKAFTGKPKQIWNILLRLLLNPIDAPFRKEHFVFYRLGSGLSSEPNAHEIGFKGADMMLIKPEKALAGRRLASGAISNLFSDIDLPVQLVSGASSLNMMIMAWIGKDAMITDELLQLNGDNRVIASVLACRENLADDQVNILIKTCAEEELECLQIDSAKRLARIVESSGSLEWFYETAKFDANPTARRGVKFVLESLADRWNILKPLVKNEALNEGLILSVLGFIELYLSSSHIGSEDCYGTISLHLYSSPSSNDVLIGCVKALLAFMRNQSISREQKENALLDLVSGLKDDQLKLNCVMAIEGLVNGIEDEEIIAMVPIFTCPLLGRMNDYDPEIRRISSETFAKLVKLVSLKSAEKPFASEKLQATYEESLGFLSQLMGDQNRIQKYEIPIKINAELRPYQQDGVNWLVFLRRNGLHGVLSDDMGLGKTLQTLIALATDRHEKNLMGIRKPSLVVCPSSLLGHWAHEAAAYCPDVLSSVLVYSGPSNERRKLAPQFMDSSLVVTSYEIVRNDLEVFEPMNWSYVVLDEGHVIRNSKTKLAQAIKALKADHRLLLSGTPIQNNVVELWALFDFLMPGFLGTESEFMEAYGKDILAVQPNVNHPTKSNNAGNGVEFDSAERKLQALHKQVLPFLLRRMKHDVLKDLPSKIIQDYECEPSLVQRLLLEDFNSNSALQEELETGREKMHVFKALQYLRKLCVHPSLVLSAGHPLFEDAMNMAAKMGFDGFNHIGLAPKLVMLKELLQECGLDECHDDTGAGPSQQHRVLLFAQQKSTLDLVASQVLSQLPSLSYLRMDGDVEANARFDIAHRFNSDPSIGLLMLTTRVGGLGLNLTGADTVIFLEHDWNPQADLQAMDRAHRLGQKRVVNVYRLVLRGTIEERILGLQTWKKKVAGTVITQQNSEADAGKGDLLDLFTGPEPSSEPHPKKAKKSEALSSWISKITGNVSDQPSEDGSVEYEQEFDIQDFVTRLRNPQNV